jgi:hypothetical protein
MHESASDVAHHASCALASRRSSRQCHTPQEANSDGRVSGRTAPPAFPPRGYLRVFARWPRRMMSSIFMLIAANRQKLPGQERPQEHRGPRRLVDLAGLLVVHPASAVNPSVSTAPLSSGGVVGVNAHERVREAQTRSRPRTRCHPGRRPAGRRRNNGGSSIAKSNSCSPLFAGHGLKDIENARARPCGHAHA